MPAYQEEIDAAIAEGIDIQFLVAPTKVLTQNNKVKGVECIRMKLGDIDSSGRRRPVPIEGSSFSIDLDILISAIGERPDISFINENDDLKTTKWDTIIADENTLLTDRKGVFAGGDAMTGPNSVVKAIAAGKTVAESIDNYLQGKSLERKYELHRPSIFVEPVELTEEEIEKAERPKMPVLSTEARHKSFKEVELGFTKEMAVKEARRCLRCELETQDGKKALGQ